MSTPSGNSSSSAPGTVNSKTDPPSKTTSKPNPSAAMLFFFIVTSVYCIMSIFVGGGDAKIKIIMKLCYFLFVVIGEYFINLSLSNSMCGTNQWRSTFYITIIPWFLIFGVVHASIAMFPGWMSPFSNTFGYLVAKLMGLPELMRSIVAPAADGDVGRAILSITTDDSLLVNQFSPEASSETIDAKGIRKTTRPIFDEAWKKLQDTGVLKKVAQFRDEKEDEKMRKKLYKFVEMKYSISEYVWNLLTGFLVTSISYNYILNNGCQKSAEDMKRRRDEYQASERKKKSDKETEKSNEPHYKQPT